MSCYRLYLSEQQHHCPTKTDIFEGSQTSTRVSFGILLPPFSLYIYYIHTHTHTHTYWSRVCDSPRIMFSHTTKSSLMHFPLPRMPLSTLLNTQLTLSFFLSFAMLQRMWDLSSPTRDWTFALCSGSSVLTTEPPGKPPNSFFSSQPKRYLFPDIFPDKIQFVSSAPLHYHMYLHYRITKIHTLGHSLWDHSFLRDKDLNFHFNSHLLLDTLILFLSCSTQFKVKI